MEIEVNFNIEYILAGDISISMQKQDCNGISRYEYMLEKFKAFMDTSKDFDKHGGCTVMLFGSKVHKYEHADTETVKKVLNKVSFECSTMTHYLIQEAFEEHLEEKSKSAKESKLHPGTCLMIFTDGEPSSESLVIREIQNIANRIDRQEEFQIIFLTVGQQSNEIKAFLKNLTTHKFKYPMVKVSPLDEVTFMEAVMSDRNV